MFDPETATLCRQSYGLAMAQGKFGGPRGVWLECTTCDESQRIVGEGALDATDADVAKVFRRHGWRGQGRAMKGAKCPACAKFTAMKASKL